MPLRPGRASGALTRGGAAWRAGPGWGADGEARGESSLSPNSCAQTGARGRLTETVPCHTHHRLHTATGTARPRSYTRPVTHEVMLHTHADTDGSLKSMTLAQLPPPRALLTHACMPWQQHAPSSPREPGQPRRALSTTPTLTFAQPSLAPAQYPHTRTHRFTDTIVLTPHSSPVAFHHHSTTKLRTLYLAAGPWVTPLPTLCSYLAPAKGPGGRKGASAGAVTCWKLVH